MKNNYRIYFWIDKEIYDSININKNFINILDNNYIYTTKSMNIERYIISIYLKTKIDIYQFDNIVNYINNYFNINTNIYYEDNKDNIKYSNIKL
tara:strand:+ start:142 stop:423 length:282 start_codon:yes stop_codon:yes gene_type:complete